MAKRRGGNPFYILVMITGTLFVLTACAYGTMTVRQLHSATHDVSLSAEAWQTWMQRHGTTLLVVELVALGLLTAAAIGTDDYWQARQQARSADRTFPDRASENLRENPP
jgi:hypothetical protein